MKCLSHRKPKRALLEREVEKNLKKEIFRRGESQKSFIPCAICANGTKSCYSELARWIKYAEEFGAELEPVCVSDSSLFFFKLTQDRKEAVKDSLDIGEQISCSALDDIGLSYSFPESNLLEDLGMHITKNPGFGYED